MKKIILFTAVVTAILFSNKTTNAQEVSYGSTPMAFMWDSLTIVVNNLRIQSPKQKNEKVSNFVRNYFTIRNDSLFSNFPSNYVEYYLDDPMTGRRISNKNMIVLESGIIEKDYVKMQRVYFLKHKIIGKKNVFITKTKAPLFVFLSL